MATVAVIWAVCPLWLVARTRIEVLPGRVGTPPMAPLPSPRSLKFMPSGSPSAARRSPFPPRSEKAGNSV